MIKTVIKGIGRYLPSRIVTSDEAEELADFKKFGVKKGLCKMLTGCEERRYSDVNEYSSDIAAKAALNAMKDAKVLSDDIDAVIFCSVSQDFVEPATANVIMDLLNIKNAFGFDVKNACNAFLTGIDIADSLIKTNKANTVLVVSGEALSKWINFKFESKEDLIKRAPVTLSVGDGGGAFILQRNENEQGEIVKSIFKTYPEYWNNNVVWGGGVRFPRDPNKMYIPGTTKVIIDEQRNLGKNLLSILQNEVGWDLRKDVNCYIPTQVAKWINRSMCKELDFPMKKIIQVVDKFGNVGASNIPIATCEAVMDGRLKKGNKALLSSVGVGINIGTIALIY